MLAQMIYRLYSKDHSIQSNVKEKPSEAKPPERKKPFPPLGTAVRHRVVVGKTASLGSSD